MEEQKVGDQVIAVHQMKESAIISIDRKLDELIALLKTADLTENDTKEIRRKINSIFPGQEPEEQILQKFEKLDDSNASRAEKADNLEQLLQGYKTDSRKFRKNTLARGAASITRMITAILLIGLGFGMIIMPAPPYFEMFTLFYINPNDGVTIMDVISLIIAFAGVSLFISSLMKFNK